MQILMYSLRNTHQDLGELGDTLHSGLACIGKIMKCIMITCNNSANTFYKCAFLDPLTQTQQAKTIKENHILRGNMNANLILFSPIQRWQIKISKNYNLPTNTNITYKSNQTFILERGI